MSTTRNTDYTQKLLQTRKNVLRTDDLRLIWGIDNPHTLRVTISRYMSRGILHPIQRGLYSALPLDMVDKYELACAICGPHSYISLETVLHNSGIIMQNINKITLLGRKSIETTVGGIQISCKYINHDYLMSRAGIDDNHNHSIASLERAIADMLNLNPNYYFDNNLAIQKMNLEVIQERVGYDVTS